MDQLLSLNLLIFIPFGSPTHFSPLDISSVDLDLNRFKAMGILNDILKTILCLCGGPDQEAYPSYGGGNYAELGSPTMSQAYGTNHSSLKSHRTTASSIYSAYHGSV